MDNKQNLFIDKNVTKEEYEKMMKPSNNDNSIDDIKIKANELPEYFYDFSFLEEYNEEDY